ncbi:MULTISPECIES: TRAP transporter small permease subunit [Dethiosulfovibrio]|jgi:TRAP-type C4-dicarboxylate transport system permease small subunit|uniref:Tripartite ATP-independent periplasmic transporter DctQ component n=4 Tax=Dethiosulfovibrio TaxID=47054 RepID=D2Z847_9BACT|nr:MULTISPECIES: TRAP transporter small permease [Dethiosulfovibrio]EFC91644.1 Tripartite ATP-independent periplasmic transporter DctQ component [Dethiosulfovibrio peptidovorans DSM 11002]MCF4114388.1 TRAP transporter small permease [Dethiosulfovibrio russensis]MCF4142951.1 TRAP transporter small permease [Dethiosulfovibrio marinus]MCF4145048.1 TRAP transporter small permease [Dethiosulfovibrio acidaminovorans]
MMITLYKKTINGLSAAMGWLCGIGTLVMGLILFYEVVRRYFFNSPTIWTQEVSVYIFMWCMFGGASYALQKGKHVNIDLLTVKLSPKAQSKLKVLTSFFGALFCSEIAVQGWDMIESAVKYQKHSPTPLHVPLWIPQSALFLGFTLLALQFVVLIIEEIAFIRTGERDSVQEVNH